MPWNGLSNISSRRYTCAHCGSIIATKGGYFSDNRQQIYICTHCDKPTHFDADGSQYPDVAPGNEIAHLPDDLAALYAEARNCAAVSSHTGSVLLCRKLLMNIAVSQGADEGLRFVEYVEYLANSGFVPPNGRGWVDHIRKKGNEATHEIALRML